MRWKKLKDFTLVVAGFRENGDDLKDKESNPEYILNKTCPYF